MFSTLVTRGVISHDWCYSPRKMGTVHYFAHFLLTKTEMLQRGLNRGIFVIYYLSVSRGAS